MPNSRSKMLMFNNLLDPAEIIEHVEQSHGFGKRAWNWL
jgi:hypothetical protein